MEMLNEKMFETCQWCNGEGKEDGHLLCPDCQGTGMKGGKYAEEKFDEYVEQMVNKNK